MDPPRPPAAVADDRVAAATTEADDAPRPSRREAARALVYASVTGEGAQGDVAAAPMLAMEPSSRYEVGPLLGQGGMGEVALVMDHVIGRHVARKTLLREVATERAFTRFVREARVQGQLEHPSVVPVYDFGAGPEGTPFFTMKRVRGETLAHILERIADPTSDYSSRFSRHKLLAAFRQVCLAVEYAHLRGVVHRDLKPSNIMLGDFGEVYVLDWGLAKLRTEEEGEGAPTSSMRGGTPSPALRADRTGEGDMLGTPAYMAPEQFGRGKNRFDTRLDVFALGAILFEILTLSRYRPGESFATLLPSLLKEADRDAPTRPSELAPGVSPELDEACARALATEPGKRLASAGAIAEVIEKYLEGDRDMGVRRALAASLKDSARARIGTPGQADVGVRVEAMRDAIKAIALTPDDVEAQRLLLSLVVDGSGTLPKEAQRDFEASEFELDVHALKQALVGLSAWFVGLPLAAWVGVRAWPLIGLMAMMNAATIGYIVLLMRWRTRRTRHVIVLNLLLATILAMSSCWLGPFVLVPVACCSIALIFASRCKPSERPWVMGIWSVAILAPFALELTHVLPPSFSFVGGEVILHPRALRLPEGPTLVALAYTSLTFMLFPVIFVGRLRDRQRDGDRRLFVQAWALTQLFPGAGREDVRVRGGVGAKDE